MNFTSFLSKTLRNSTALAVMSLSSFSVLAMDHDDVPHSIIQAKQLYPSYERIPFELKPSGNAQTIETDAAGKIRKVTTDNNNLASYQLESNRFPVVPGNIISVPYRLKVERDSIISLGLLNTSRNGWYPSKDIISEKILETGEHAGVCEWIVPEGERETSLVFRNYHLTAPRTSKFTIEALDIQKEKPIKLNSTGISANIQWGDDGKITVVTDSNNWGSYQLRTDQLSVVPGNIISVPYKIKVEQNSIISLGLLNTSRTGWYLSKDNTYAEMILEAGEHEGVCEWIVPAKDTKTSLVFRNYHLDTNGGAGQSTFTIEKIGIQQEETPESLLSIRKSSMGGFYDMAPDTFMGIFQNCTLQDIVSVSCTSKMLWSVCQSDVIWQFFLQSKGYTFDNLMAQKNNFKFNYLYPEVEIVFNNLKEKKLEDFKIQIKHLLLLMDHCPLSPNNRTTYFKIGASPCRLEYNFALPQEHWSSRNKSLDSLLSELINPEAYVTCHYCPNLTSTFVDTRGSLIDTYTFKIEFIMSSSSRHLENLDIIVEKIEDWELNEKKRADEKKERADENYRTNIFFIKLLDFTRSQAPLDLNYWWIKPYFCRNL